MVERQNALNCYSKRKEGNLLDRLSDPGFNPGTLISGVAKSVWRSHEAQTIALRHLLYVCRPADSLRPEN
jgi:hypothetical protein